MDDTGIAVVRVQGTAIATAMPDRAEVRLTVSHVAKDRAAALTVAATKADAVGAVLREVGLDDDAWRTSGVRVGAEYDWRDNRRVLTGHRAVAQFTVSVRQDLDMVDTIVREAVGRADADVDGPDWIVSAANPGRREAYAQAALDARARAEAYAGALGLRLGSVLRIEEPSADDGGRPRPRMMLTAASGADHTETVHAGQVEIDARVTVTFALTGGAP